MTIKLLGSSGLFGSAIARQLEQQSLPFVRFSGQELMKIANFQGPEALDKFLSLSAKDVVINGSGVTKHRLGKSRFPNFGDAYFANTLLPRMLERLASRSGAWILQPGTDCVFSGLPGPKFEGTPHDAEDIYGLTKSLGEVNSERVTIIRSSFIGRTRGTHSGQLVDWLLGHERNSSVSGFSNHEWSGVPVSLLSRIFVQLAVISDRPPGIFHLAPSNKLTKFELLRLIASFSGRDDLEVTEVESPRAVMRALSTSFPEVNLNLFQMGGFSTIPSIEETLEREASNVFD